jgi:putative transcriptional regulator
MCDMSHIINPNVTDFCIVTNKKAETFRKKLGKKIRELRKAQKISQGQLAFEAGVRREAITHIERGEQNATTDTLYSIANALGVHIREMVDFEY